MSDTREKAIRERAYALWEKSGSEHGQHGEHWDQAVREIDAEAPAAKGKPGRKPGVKSAATPTPKVKAKPGPKPKIVAAPVAPEPKVAAKTKVAAKPVAAPKAATAPKAKVAPRQSAAPATTTVGKAKQAAEKVVATVKRATKGTPKK